jgi:two-component system OmpR family response regulator
VRCAFDGGIGFAALSWCPYRSNPLLATICGCLATHRPKAWSIVVSTTRIPDAEHILLNDSIAEDEPIKSAAIFSSALSKVRETSHSIEDRVRNLFTPDGPSIAELRVLAVDDHPDAADSLVAVLELVGCTARACYSGWSALDVIEEFEPQVCLLDLMMPDLGGLELAARLRVWAGHRPLLLIAVTALGDEATLRRAAVAGFDWHTTKPVDVQELLGTISRLWGLFGPGHSGMDRR